MPSAMRWRRCSPSWRCPSAALFSGALITETMFAWPGMGKAIYQAILDNDYNLALGRPADRHARHHARQPAGRPRLRLGRPARVDRAERMSDIASRPAGQPGMAGVDPPDAPSPGAGLAGLPAGPAGPVARRPLDRRLARHRSHRDRPLPPLRAALGRALAGHRRSRPRSLPAPARRRPRVAAGRHLGRAPVGGHRRPDRRRRGLSRRPARCAC